MYDLISLFTQIATETLPISSSAHVLAIRNLLREGGTGSITNLWAYAHFHLVGPLLKNVSDLKIDSNGFEHFPTLLVIALFFRDNWLPYIRHPIRHFPTILKLLALTLTADLITTGMQLLFKLFGTPDIPIYYALLGTSGLLFVASVVLFLKPCPRLQIPPLIAYAIIGLVQGIALIPGISRLAATTTVGMMLGLSPHKAFRASFMLAAPLYIGSIFLDLMTKGIAIPITLSGWITVSAATILSYPFLAMAHWLFVKNRTWILGTYLLIFATVWAHCLPSHG